MSIYTKHGDLKFAHKLKVISHNPKMLRYILTTRCSRCNQLFVFPKISTQNTRYENEWSNYTLCCKYCKEVEENYWEEMWNDYYSSR